MRRARAFMGVFMLLALACESPTQLIVVVDSDIAGVVAVEAGVSAGLGEGANHRFLIEETGIPFSFGVGRGDGDTDDVHMIIEAYGDSPNGIVMRTIDTSFIQGQTVQLHVPLNADCNFEHACEDMDMTCFEGACIEYLVDSSMLPTGIPDVTPRMVDAGPRIDGGPSPDGGGECVMDAPCSEPDNPCRTGQWQCDGDEPACSLTGTLPAGSPCGSEGRVCNAEDVCGPP